MPRSHRRASPSRKVLLLGASVVLAAATSVGVYQILPAQARGPAGEVNPASVAVSPTAAASSAASSAAAVASVSPTVSLSASPTAKRRVSASASPRAARAAGEPFKGVANSACADMDRLTSSWFYNWGTSPAGCTGHGFVPMVSGKNEKTTAQVTAAIDQLGAAGYDRVLGFNEPNKSDQANLSVSEVVSLWPALTGDASIAVGSPATSADTAGQQWFTDFMTQVESQKLRVDFVAVHWYGWNAGSCDAGAAEFEKYLNWVQGKAGGRPLWITEFGCLNASNPDEATVQAFYTGAVKMFARHSQVERYAWYPWITNNHLVADDGALTALGTTFAQQASTR